MPRNASLSEIGCEHPTDSENVLITSLSQNRRNSIEMFVNSRVNEYLENDLLRWRSVSIGNILRCSNSLSVKLKTQFAWVGRGQSVIAVLF